MALAVTHYWDTRLLYIYALLGGFTEQSDEDISKDIVHQTNDEWCIRYNLTVLSHLEDLGKISVTEITFNEHKALAKAIELGYPPSAHWMSNDKNTVLKMAKDRLKDTSNAKQLDNLTYLFNNVDRYHEWALKGTVDFNFKSNDRDWFRERVNGYLELYERNELFTATHNESLPYQEQTSWMLNQIGRAMRTHEINTGGESSPGKNNTAVRALENILSLANHKVLTIYSLSIWPDGRFSIPHISARITLLNPSPEKLLPIEHSSNSENTTVAELILQGRQLYLQLEGSKHPLRKPFRPESGLHNFMNYLFSHPNQKIGRGVINTEVEGAKTFTNLTEIVRKCGFDPALKDIFFPGTTQQTVFFSPKQLISGEQYEQLRTRFADRHESPQTAT